MSAVTNTNVEISRYIDKLDQEMDTLVSEIYDAVDKVIEEPSINDTISSGTQKALEQHLYKYLDSEGQTKEATQEKVRKITGAPEYKDFRKALTEAVCKIAKEFAELAVESRRQFTDLPRSDIKPQKDCFEALEASTSITKRKKPLLRPFTRESEKSGTDIKEPTKK